MRRILFLATLLVSVVAQGAELAWPTITSQTRPWTRWWWLGNIGTEQDFTSEMQKYAAAGFGGLEITPIYGVRGEEKRFTTYLSPEWAQKLKHVISEGRRLDLGIDMATGTGWPFGGPWVSPEDTAKYLAHARYTVRGGQRLTEPVRFVQRPVVRVAGPRRVTLAELKEPITANANLQDLALDQVRFEKPLPLISLMAFSAQGTAVDLTSKVGLDGMLDWTAPEGEWTLYGLFAGQHGKMVERAGPGGEGFAVDHLSRDSVTHYLQAFERAHAHGEARGLRAYFNDSYEVDDAEGEHDWTPRFLEEFNRRRGYDLRTQLAALFSKENPDAPARVLSDYRETVSDLLLEGVTVTWHDWAKQQGSLIRNQAHGSPANILDLYAASDIPEQEGSDILSIKLASSAAHVLGKPLASAETGTWLDEHFVGTFAELRFAVDTFLLGGVNHNCYHGTAFSPPGEPWPGFQFYASVELNPSNPLWREMSSFNGYVARAQAFLQSGRPDEDVVLYYNIHDRWARRGTGALPHFSGRQNDGLSVREAAASLQTAGVGFDYVSDRLLNGAKVHGDRIETPGSSYRAIMVPPTRFMPLATLQHLVELAENGATLVFHRRLPEDAPGLHDAKITAAFAELLTRLQQNLSDEKGLRITAVGKGRVILGDDLPALLARAGIRGEPMARTEGLKFIRRTNDSGAFYFLTNRSAQRFDGWVDVLGEGASAALFDPMTGHAGVAAFTSTAGGKASRVYLQLEPRESRIVQLYRTAPAADTSRWSYWKSEGDAQPLPGPWNVTFVAGGPALPGDAQIPELTSWTNLADAAAKAFSGTAVYTLTVPRPPRKPAAWQIDLGRVAEIARAKWNGRDVAALLQPPYRIQIPDTGMQDRNTLEIEVTNLAANRIADLDRHDPSWKRFYNTNMPARRRENAGLDGMFSPAKWSPRDSGLLGPVTLTPLQPLNPANE